MAVPTFVAAGTFASGTGDIVPGLPAGWAADDIHLLIGEYSAVNAPPSAPTGWTAIPDCALEAGALATDGCSYAFWRRAVAGDTAPTVADTINHTSGQIFGFRGCIATGDPWDVISFGTDAVADQALSVTGATTTVADCLVFVAYFHGTDNVFADYFASVANADLASFTVRADVSHTAGNGGGFGVSTGGKAAAGAYGATTATQAANSTKAFFTVALKPPAAAGTVDLTGVSTIVLNTVGEGDQIQKLAGVSTLVVNSTGEADQIQKLAAVSTIAINSTAALKALTNLIGTSTIAINSTGEGDQIQKLAGVSTLVVNSTGEADQIQKLAAVSTIVVNSAIEADQINRLASISTIVLNSTGQARQIHTLDGVSTIVVNSLIEADQIHRLVASPTIVINSLLDLDLIARLLSTGTVVLNSAGVLTVTGAAAVVTTRGYVTLAEVLVGAMSTSQTLVGKVTPSETLVGKVTPSETLVGASSITEG